MYLERYNIDQLELLQKFNIIEWTLFDASLSCHDKYEATANNISALKKHLEELYITHSIEWSRLTKHEQTVYDQLEQLTKYSDGLTTDLTSLLTPQHTPQEGPAAPSLAGMQPEQFDISDEDDDVNGETPLTTPSYD